MTIEDKVKDFDSRFERLGGIYSGDTLNFSLFCEAVEATRTVEECGLGNLLTAVKAGDVDRVCMIRDHLKPQFDLWFEYYKFVKKERICHAFTFVSSSRLYKQDRPGINPNGLVVIPFWLYAQGEKQHLIKKSTDNHEQIMAKISSQILFATRLLDHCLVRALKHPRHKMTKS